MLERDFQGQLKKELKELFPGCIITKNDSAYIQGIPDLLILYKDKWAALEVKKYKKASHRPNQDGSDVFCSIYLPGEQRGGSA